MRESGVPSAGASSDAKGYRASILLAILCGFLAPMLNYSFAFGQEIARHSVAAGNSNLLAAWESRTRHDLETVSISVVSRDALIAMKLAH